MSALSLEKNERVSSSKRTKHIKAKYFLIKEYYDAGEIDLRYCPTDSMWADVLTKPLQGQKFLDMRAFLQNFSRDYDDDFEREEDERGRHLSWFDHLSSADSELTAPLGWQKSGLSQDSTLTQILSNGVLALDNANTNKSL